MHIRFWLPMAGIVISFFTFSCQPTQAPHTDIERLYLTTIREDFLAHREDVAAINTLNAKIVNRIDSLLNGFAPDNTNSALTKGIMNTRSYTQTIFAYKNILNGQYLNDDELKLKIARHVAKFEGLTVSKRTWDSQWDAVARPYLYKYGLSSRPDDASLKNNLISDPEFRALLWDRRMFAHDVEIWTPRILSSADSILAILDKRLQNRN